MRKWIFSLLILSSCYDGNHTSSLVESPILNRPIVAVVPVIDHSRNHLTWNISTELSQAIRQRMAQKNRLYLIGEEAVISMAKRSFNVHDPFGVDTAWVKKAFPQNEFVVFMELFEHNEVPIYTTQDSPAELEVAVRVRVFDLRKEIPHIVLQEIVQQAHHIPRQFNQVVWGDETFETSPLGLAHEALCKEISSRIEDYILLSGN